MHIKCKKINLKQINYPNYDSPSIHEYHAKCCMYKERYDVKVVFKFNYK